uniref:General transcription factor IIH subunit 3 n=1 Tax=Rhabditophanes sp. KR3021 TaxID=114890 RepID=A0AC35TTJ8_9BILA
MSCQVVIFDCNIGSMGKFLASQKIGSSFDIMITSIAAYGSYHLSISPSNKFVLIAAGKGIKNRFIYISDQSANVNPSSEILANFRKTFREVLQIKDKSKFTEYAAPMALALCQIRRFKAQNAKGSGKILVYSTSLVAEWQKDLVLNTAFAAQQNDIMIDAACILSKSQFSPILHQCCSITNGLYLNVDKPFFLLQYLTRYFAPEKEARTYFNDYKVQEVEYSPKCICHGKEIKIGFVCCVCLSIHCDYDTECHICQTIYQNKKIPLTNGKMVEDLKKIIKFTTKPSQHVPIMKMESNEEFNKIEPMEIDNVF